MNISRLDVLREMNKRDGLDKKLQDELMRLEAGAVGERTVLEFIEEFGAKHWKVLINVWFDAYGLFECDLILLTLCGLYTFEIKNYSGVYEYKNSQCIQNGRKIGHNAISQAQKSFIYFKDLMTQNGFHIPIKGAVVFAGEHCEVKIYDEIEDLKVIQLNQLRNYIWQIMKDENEYVGQRISIEEVLRFINKVRVDNPFPPEPISAEMSRRLRKGIMCSNCGAFDVDSSKSYVVCQCGMHEPRENAIVRTICEYGVIHFDKELVTKELLTFFNHQISHANLLEYLKKHFNRLGMHKRTVFENKRALFSDIYQRLNLVKERILHLNRYS